MDKATARRILEDIQILKVQHTKNVVEHLENLDDVKAYKGKWTIYILMKNGKSGHTHYKYENKTEVEKDIINIWNEKDILTYGNDETRIPLDKISSLIPMPIGNK